MEGVKREGGPNALLEVRHLSVDYHAENGTVHALTDVSLTLERGRILGLAGESGSGKSTLGYAVTRLLKPPAEIVAGEALYYPRAARAASEAARPVDVLKLTPKQLRALRWTELAIVFQSAMNALNPVLDIGAQITDVLRAHQRDLNRQQQQARAIELLRMVGIAPDRLRSFPHELSGGMRQRAIIAIALALAPDLIIMDEPTTALDVVVQREILMEVMALRAELAFSVIFITHDLSLLLELADTIAIMYAGRVVELATRDELKRSPRHPYSFGMLNSFPTIHGERRHMTGIPGSPPDLRGVAPGCAFAERCPVAIAACWTETPRLRPASGPGDTQLTACHLYDPRYRAGALPSAAEFAAGYEAAYTQGRMERSGR